LRAGAAERDDILAASAEVLQVINASPGALKPVFDAILEKAMRLCEAAFGIFARYDGDLVHAFAFRGLGEDVIAGLTNSFRPHPGGPMAKALNTGNVVQLGDLRDSDAYRSGAPGGKLADVAGARTVVWVPLRKDNISLGLMVLFRCEVRPFTDRQIRL